MDDPPQSFDFSDLGFKSECRPSEEEVEKAYFLDGTTVNVGRDHSFATLIADQPRIDEFLGRLAKGTLETAGESAKNLLTFLGVLDGDGTVVGRLREFYMGEHFKEHSRYWSGPGILNVGFKVFDTDGKELKLANPFLKNSTAIGFDAHNWICEDFRTEIRRNPKLKSYRIHLVGYSRGAEIALDVANRVLNGVWYAPHGCNDTDHRIPEVASLAMVDPVPTAMGIIDFFSLTWVQHVPDHMPHDSILILEKSIDHEDLKNMPLTEFVQLSILRTLKLDGVHHKFILGDGKVLENGRIVGGKTGEHVNHTEISHNLNAAEEIVRFLTDRGACFSGRFTR
jgi:hypothetical protein